MTEKQILKRVNRCERLIKDGRVQAAKRLMHRVFVKASRR